MIAKIEFNLPEDQQLLQDYQDGIKCKYLLQEFTQKWSKLFKDEKKIKKISSYELLQILYSDINQANINLFD